MKSVLTFWLLAMFLSLSALAQSRDTWNPVVRVHVPKGDTSEVFVFSTESVNFSKIDTVRAEKVKDNTFYFELPDRAMRFFLATSDKYEPEVVFVSPVDAGDYIDLYLKTPRKEPLKDSKEETARLLQIMLEKFPYPELLSGDRSNNKNYERIDN